MNEIEKIILDINDQKKDIVLLLREMAKVGTARQKVDTLMLLEKNGIFGYAAFIQHVFEEEEEIVKERAEGYSTDCYFTIRGQNIGRHANIQFAYICSDILDDPQSYCNENDAIEVAFCRGKAYELSVPAFIDKVFDFVAKNEILGFQFDW